MTDNEPREEVRNIEVHQKDGTVKKLVEVVPVYTIGLIEDLIKQHTDRARWQEVRAMLNIPEPSRTKLLRDRLNQLKESK